MYMSRNHLIHVCGILFTSFIHNAHAWREDHSRCVNSYLIYTLFIVPRNWCITCFFMSPITKMNAFLSFIGSSVVNSVLALRCTFSFMYFYSITVSTILQYLLLYYPTRIVSYTAHPYTAHPCSLHVMCLSLYDCPCMKVALLWQFTVLTIIITF